jgi:hypothetical protein
MIPGRAQWSCSDRGGSSLEPSPAGLVPGLELSTYGLPKSHLRLRLAERTDERVGGRP